MVFFLLIDLWRIYKPFKISPLSLISAETELNILPAIFILALYASFFSRTSIWAGLSAHYDEISTGSPLELVFSQTTY